MFSGCSKLTTLDLSVFNTNIITDVSDLFDGCVNLRHIDMRNFDFTKVTRYSDMFGYRRLVPADCEIIVKDDTAKTWITSKFSRLTNVKTVAEL